MRRRLPLLRRARRARSWRPRSWRTGRADATRSDFQPLGRGAGGDALELSRSGRSSASPRRRWWPATSVCSKHASNVPQCALALEDLVSSRGRPEGVFQTLLVGSDRVERIIADDRVAAVTVDGQRGGGRDRSRPRPGTHLKKCVLELGGSDAVHRACRAPISTRRWRRRSQARLVNSGQSCIAAKRFIVADAVYEEFAASFAAAMGALVVGDPMRPRHRGRTAGAGGDPRRASPTRSRVRWRPARVSSSEVVPRWRRLLLPADRARRRAAVGARVAREEVFGPVAAALPGGRHRRGDRARQREHVRPGRGGLHARPRGGRAARPRARGGQRVHQRHRRVRPTVPVWRREALRASGASSDVYGLRSS